MRYPGTRVACCILVAPIKKKVGLILVAVKVGHDTKEQPDYAWSLFALSELLSS